MKPTDRLQQRLHDLPEPYVALGVGIPGSGKTTVLKRLSEDLGVIRVSPDDIREELTGDQASQSVNSEAWNETYRRVEAALQLGHSAIVDATHTEAFRRPQTVEMYRSYGASAVVAIVFDTPLHVAKVRNAKRERVVPERVLYRMHSALRREPVSGDEGFDEIFFVRS